MDIQRTYDTARGRFVLSVHGLLSAAALQAALEGLNADPELEESRSIVWDLSEANGEELKAEEVRELVHHGVGLTALGHLKTAIVAPRDLEFGLGRMAEAYMAGDARSVRIFRSRDEASAWLDA